MENFDHEVIVATLINDPLGRAIWKIAINQVSILRKRNFAFVGNQHPPQDEINYPFEIDWVEVIDGINAATSLHLNSGDPELECLKAQICMFFFYITIYAPS